ncbi:unnamed protein product [Rotaria socialis]|uniref:Uncharacterized protein n=1 Tax=Rotaria socialis TaxID=392032 RepID=A0A817XG07_9BILA|nr:unnamed protein product [Rotaria socialis]CAF3366235.1 unnamed protein product [Rotaria socialis]CAF3411758.1 unnamed protein product [Rotaria socialis]CAF3414065.1 unnamed protein product [Rotaria socialis]
MVGNAESSHTNSKQAVLLKYVANKSCFFNNEWAQCHYDWVHASNQEVDGDSQILKKLQLRPSHFYLHVLEVSVLKIQILA